MLKSIGPENQVYGIINSEVIKLFLREVSFGWPVTVQIRLTSSRSIDQSNHPILMKQLLIDSQDV